MTAQMHDKFLYEGEELSITKIGCDLGWSPQRDLRLRPEAVSSGCWRGYKIFLAIDEEKQLFISRLGINLYKVAESRHEYGHIIGPKINGIMPEIDRDRDGLGFNNIYEGVNIPLGVTGEIVISKNFIQEMYVHMGYQDSNRFATVFELNFQDGKLVGEEDISSEMARERSKLPEADGFEGMREIANGRTTHLRPEE
jgi:hypothetical protein